MAFSTIITVVIIGYVFLYIGMIAYDLFFKKDPADLIPKQEDEDVDISDEAGKFQPVLIERETKPNSRMQGNAPPVVLPENDTGNDDKKFKENGGVITDDEEPSNRKSLRDKGGNQKSEDDNLSEEDKSRLEYMERQKQERLRLFGLDKGNDQVDKSESDVVNVKFMKEETDKTDSTVPKTPQVSKTSTDSSEPLPTDAPYPPKRKRYESAKKEIPLPDDLPKASTFNPVVRIDEDACQTKHEGGHTVEQLETEVKETFEDKIALARKIAESGWQLYNESIPDVAEEDILEPPTTDDGSPPPKASAFNSRANDNN